MKYHSRAVVSLVEEAKSEGHGPVEARRASWAASRRGSLLSGLFSGDSNPKRRASCPASPSPPSSPPAPWTLAPPFLTAPEYARERPASGGKGKSRKGSGSGKTGRDELEQAPVLDSLDRGLKPRRGRLATLLKDPVNFLRSTSPPTRRDDDETYNYNSRTRPRLSHSSSSSSSGSSWFMSETDSVSSGYSLDPEHHWRPSGAWMDQGEIDPLDTDVDRTPNPSLRQSLLDRRRLRSSASIHTTSSASSYATAISKPPSELEMTISTYFDRKSVFLALPPFPSSAPSTPSYAPTLETVWEPTWPAPTRQRCSA